MRERTRAVATRKLFLRWALVNVLFLVGLITAALSYNGNVPTPAKLAIGAVLLVFASGSAYAGRLSWNEKLDTENNISEAAGLCPMVAILGTVTGFLIALSGPSTGSSKEDVVVNIQGKVLGASSGLLATFVGISCAIVLIVLRLPLREHVTPTRSE